MTASLAYVAAATNRFNQAADVSPSCDIIVFGSSRLLALWKLDSSNDNGISRTLPGNQHIITCVKFLSDDLFISTNEGGILSLWKRTASEAGKWKNTISIQAHSKSISSACVLDDCVITGSSDSLLKVWEVHENAIVERQSINLKGKLPIVSALTHLPQVDASLLAVGGTDGKVHLWIRSEDQFVHSASLAGHEDWVRSLAFRYPVSDDMPLVLASGSQDATIRLWNIEPRKGLSNQSSGSNDAVDELLDDFEASLGELGENDEGGKQVSLKHHIMTVKAGQEGSLQYSVTFDALLIGHEAGVTSLSWRPEVSSTSTLLSTSTDSSLILWSPSTLLDSSNDHSSSIWINRQRFGDVGGQRLGGFVGGLWARNGAEVLAHGWAGGWRRWRASFTDGGVSNETWTEVGAVAGHNGPVKGLDWSLDGKYIISSGLDQTTRIHAPIQMDDHLSWHEISRPQVHGYDLLNVVFIEPLKFASIADEKVIRIFEAPRAFVELTGNLGIAQFGAEEHERPVAANVPPLGLSNKAISNGPKDVVGDHDSSRRPFDGELAAITLWPEIEKIFGHGYESITLGISNSRKLIATACKATNAEHAVVRIYDTTQFKLFGEPLQGHILTVTRIAFSPDDKYVLTVSRDRTWRLFELHETGGYTPVAADKSHGRIIWDCGWSLEGDVFATASRDKSVKLWQQKEVIWSAVASIKLQQPATAVAFTSEDSRKRRHLAIGLETGDILLYSNSATSISEWRLEGTITSEIAHVDHIHRMAWRPSTRNPHEIATCSEDGTLRILRMHLSLD